MDPDSVLEWSKEEIMLRYEKLKDSRMDNVKDCNITDNFINENEFKNTLNKFNFLIKEKINEMNIIKTNIDELEKYKTEIEELLIDICNHDKKYRKIFLSYNLLEIKNVKIKPPEINNILFPNEYMSKIDDIVEKNNYWNIQNIKDAIFSMKDEYKNSLIESFLNIVMSIKIETEKLTHINKLINSYRNTIQLFDINNKFIKGNCTICYENEVNICLVPCGHSFCKKCTNKSNTNKCYICNQRYTSKNKLFLSAMSEETINPKPSAVTSGRSNNYNE